MFLIKFMFYFSLSFLILSYPTKKDQKVFNHIDDIASPYTAKIHNRINSFVKGSAVEVSNISKKLFQNSSGGDKIKSQQSSTKRKEINLPQDSYTVEEREALLNILRQN